MKPTLALIIPVKSGAHPDHELPKPPAAGGAPPRPDQGLPGSQPGIDNTLPGQLPRPSHPIFYPLPPGAPVDPSYGIPETPPPRPDQGLPGAQPTPTPPIAGKPPGVPTHPIAPGGETPTHPIVLPPDSGGWEPVFIWGPSDPRPTPPIALPPTKPPGVVAWETIWTPANGWQVVGIVEPEKPVPTPSKK